MTSLPPPLPFSPCLLSPATPQLISLNTHDRTLAAARRTHRVRFAQRFVTVGLVGVTHTQPTHPPKLYPPCGKHVGTNLSSQRSQPRCVRKRALCRGNSCIHADISSASLYTYAE